MSRPFPLTFRTLATTLVSALSATLALGCSSDVENAGSGGAGGNGSTAGSGQGAAQNGGSGGTIEPIEIGEVPEDFSLTDENTTSLTSGDAVSPRDYLETVSGWYFGHAT